MKFQLGLSLAAAPGSLFLSADRAMHGRPWWAAFWLTLAIAHALIVARELRTARTEGSRTPIDGNQQEQD